jgi:hypothetical protein
MQIPPINLRIYALKLCLALIVASVLFHTLIGAYYVRGLLPLIKLHLAVLYPDRRVVSFRFTEHKGEEAVIASARVTHPSPKGAHVTRRTTTQVGMYTKTLSIAPILVYGLFLTWPWVPFRRRLYGLWWPTVLLAMVDSCAIALMLGSRIALSVGVCRGAVDSLMYNALARGGLQFVAVIVFLLSIAPFHLHLRAPRAPVPPPNAPCPCGSGKKFKKCCGR